MKPYSIDLADDILIIENSLMLREYQWNDGHLISRKILDKRDNHCWQLSGDAPDLFLPGVTAEPVDGTISVIDVPATSIEPAHGRAEIRYRLGELEVMRVFRVYPRCPAIACDFFLRGKLNPGSISSEEFKANVMERIATAKLHLRATAVQFFDMTDRENNLVMSQSLLPYRRDRFLKGNLLFIRDLLEDTGLFILKEAPCSDVQLATPGYDFACKQREMKLIGLGITPGDVHETRWTRCYGFATGVARGDEFSLISTLRTYQTNWRTHLGDRDEMLLLNTWGDRGQDTRICESFALNEIGLAGKLGITHFQLDDGWQQGHSSNSARPGGSLEQIWEQENYWAIHPEKFPNGFTPLIQRAREFGIQIGLWFNPSKDNSYQNWQKDAAVLIEMYQKYGIRTFKIDGVDIPDKQAEINFRAMLDSVMHATGNNAVFNLDITAGRRFGYHYFYEYGNKFLENRYTDWINYYPHWTLRNLWTLSRYVPPQNLQIEFLNKWRNADKYPEDDPLAPHNVPFEYCFAITMMAQPLAWFEAANLPPDAFELGKTIREYLKHRDKIHAGHIFPIGEEPCGTSWTGFQSIVDATHGYFLVFREFNERSSAALVVWNLAGKQIECKQLIGGGKDFRTQVTGENKASFHLDQKFSFALYEYSVQ